MSTSYYSNIVYGVLETPAMREARKFTVDVIQDACPNSHPLHGHARFCPMCGEPIVKQTVPKQREMSAVEVYAPEGRDPENNPLDYDFVMTEWVHTNGPAAGETQVALGICLIRKFSYDAGIYTLPEPTQEQKDALADYLNYLGLDALPSRHLIIEAM